MLTIPQIINIAKLSQAMADDAAANGSLFGQVTDHMLGLKLYVLRKDIEDIYNNNPNYSGLVEASNYLFELCNPAAAALVIGGGGSVTPVQPLPFIYLIPITGAQFFDSTNYNDPRIVTKQLSIFWNDINRYLFASEYQNTALGVQILIPGFDAVANPSYDLIIYIINPTL